MSEAALAVGERLVPPPKSRLRAGLCGGRATCGDGSSKRRGGRGRLRSLSRASIAFAEWLAIGTICRGVALARSRSARGRDGGAARGHCQMGAGRRQGDWHHVVWPRRGSSCGRWPARCRIRDLGRATALAEANGEVFYKAELHRLRGAFHLQKGENAEAEHWLNEAIELARSQSARSLELRAAMALARLWRGQGRHADSRDVLSPVYDWFTEGFDTPDLAEARALLNTLE